MDIGSLTRYQMMAACDEFGIVYRDNELKADILEKLVEAGVTGEMFVEAFGEPDANKGHIPKKVTASYGHRKQEVLAAQKRANGGSLSDEEEPGEEEELVPLSPKVLLKMERKNPTFEVRGYKFSLEHPFVPVDEDDANYILDNVHGFKIAMPSEAEDFYK